MALNAFTYFASEFSQPVLSPVITLPIPSFFRHFLLIVLSKLNSNTTHKLVVIFFNVLYVCIVLITKRILFLHPHPSQMQSCFPSLRKHAVEQVLSSLFYKFFRKTKAWRGIITCLKSYLSILVLENFHLVLSIK